MNSKKIIAGIMAFCLMGGVMPSVVIKENNVITASAVNYKDGTYEQLKYRKYEDHVEITACDTSATEVVIPAEIDGVPVTVIKEEVFRKCEFLSSITIPETVTSIGNKAFIGTIWLEEKRKENPLVIINNIVIDGRTCSGDVTIPEGVTSIGDSAFTECDTLTSLVIPDSVTVIGKGAFWNCKNLTSVNIPENITNIDNGTFYMCNSLKSITIPDGVTNIGNSAFEDCNALTSVTIPDGVTMIGHSAFSHCDNLTSVTIPDSVTDIYSYAFQNCTNLKSITLPDGVTFIRESTFNYCTNLTSVKLPANLEKIGLQAFYFCSSLTAITLPDGLREIEGSAFSYCDVLESITLPESVRKISGVFSSCPVLTSVTILNPECEMPDSANSISNGRDENDNIYFNGTIYGYENSTAQAYAEKYGYKFEVIGGTVETSMGDIDGDGIIDASDASFVLAEYALLSTGDSGTFIESIKKSADINKDGQINSVDSSLILSYYAYTSTGGKDKIEKFLETSDI